MKKLKRDNAWPEKLNKFFESVHDDKFQWGKHDCCLFVCRAVFIMTGVDLARGFRGYKSEFSAQKLLKQRGGLERICETVTEKHGMKEVPVLFARRGDVLLFESEQGMMLGIVNMNGQEIVSVSLDGLGFVPLRNALRAWRV